jgi:hypothetical protein
MELRDGCVFVIVVKRVLSQEHLCGLAGIKVVDAHRRALHLNAS